MSLANLQILQDSPADLNSEFKQQRFAILKLLEGSVPTPYFDSKGLITIGIGFNIDLLKNRDLVMGAQGMGLSSDQQAAIEAAWNSPTMAEIRALPQTTKTQLWAKNAELCASLNNVLGTQSFSMTDTQIKTVFDVLVLEHQNAITSLISTPSIEQIVLTSMHYNGPALLGAGFRAAISQTAPNDARAETWYQIRYVHKAGQNEVRRYMEAALFGLYPLDASGQPAVTLDVARATYRMFTLHRDEMLAYDASATHQDNLVDAWNNLRDYPAKPNAKPKVPESICF